MKILWKINSILPFPAHKVGMEKNVFGGWLESLLKVIVKNEEIDKIGVISNYKGCKLQIIEDGKILYYLVPCKKNLKFDKSILNYYEQINNEFKPDLVHIHGTEFPNNYAYFIACPNNLFVTSLQGLISECKNYYFADLKLKDIIKATSLKDIIRFNTLFNQKENFGNRGKYEIKILQKSNIIVGRTSWDKACTFKITDINKYRFCNENLRDCFYNKVWDYNRINKYTIFVSQATYPIKGFHKILEAAHILKEKYPKLKIYVAGSNIISSNNLKEKLTISGYALYIKRLIKKYHLENNVIFTGILNDDQLSDMMLKCNVFVQASSIENSSNSLGEAMILGMPIVASYVGGTGDLLKDKKEGFLYPFSDYTLLAYYISYIFENPEEAKKIGINASNHAKITHNREENAKKMIEIYKELLNEVKK